MIRIHHLNNSRSQRILWLMEELDLPYEMVKHQRDAETNLAPPSLLAVHPLGKAPVMVDGDITIAESGAIVEYVSRTYGLGRLMPDDSPTALKGRPIGRKVVAWGEPIPLDVVKAIMVGAHATQMVSALVQQGPNYLAQIRRDLERWLEKHGIESLQQIQGSMSMARCRDGGDAYQRANYIRLLQSKHSPGNQGTGLV